MENKNIYQKLLAAQMEIGAITKTQDNPFFHSKYADINAILAVVKPILNKHGLILTQALHAVEGRNGLLTTLSNIDDDKSIASYVFLPEKSASFNKDGQMIEMILDAQKQGSSITYFRRYALQSLLALESQDDDGNKASEDKGYAYPTYKAPTESKHEKDFMVDLEPTYEEIITWQEKLESARTLAELKDFWKLIPPMGKDKLEKIKNDLKFKLT